MEVDFKVANNDYNGFSIFTLNLDLNDTIGDIKNELMKNENINKDNKKNIVLSHINSGLIFSNNNININKIIQELNINNDNRLCFNVMSMSMSNNNNNNNNNNNDKELIICNLESEIEQYREQISNLEKIIRNQNENENINENINEDINENINENMNENMNEIDEISESQKLRLKNEAHVQQRRQSRIMIVKSKISSEIQRESRKMIEYLEDSPFFWSCLNESENRIKRLSLRLEKICDMILDLCSVTITFSEHCSRIHNLVKKSWADVELNLSSDIISLSSIFNELGEQFAHMSNASKQLAVTLKAVLVDAFRDFTQQHLSNVSTSSKTLQILEREYENALRKLLHSHKNLPKINPKRAKNINKNGNKNINKNKKTNILSNYERITDLEQYEEWKKKTMDLRKNYELKRYDHCNTLNAVINRHRYELILNLCACFSAFETFFHVGYEASLGNKVFHRSIQMGIAQKTLSQDKNDKKLKTTRNEIENILLLGKDYHKKDNKIILDDKKEDYIDDDDDDDDDDDEEKEEKEYNIDYYSGYLWKQSSNMKKDWKRRWFVLENGELGYYRSKDKLEREFVVNTMLCKVKERLDHDYRYVFELISPSRRIYVLQAQSNEDYIAWCNVLRNQVHRLLRKNTINNNNNVYNNTIIKNEKRELKRIIQETNKICADCGKKEPEWVSINTGVIICIDCAGIHRGLGTHISKIRSLILDDINESVLKSLLQLGNNKTNKILQNTIPSDYSIISYQSNTNEKEKYIKGKYMFKMFIDPIKNKQMTHQQINEKLYYGAINNNLLNIFEALCYGANIDYQFQNYSNKTALHETALHNYIEATEFLLQNGANQNIQDDNGKFPRELAEDNQSDQVLSILEYHLDTLQYIKPKNTKQIIVDSVSLSQK